MHNSRKEYRAKDFKKNTKLEDLLTNLNFDLWVAERRILNKNEIKFPLIFIVGPHRSGTTLLLQWLANLGSFAYPSNLLSRFYQAPIIGAKIQLLLTDEHYNFRDELKDLSEGIDFSSENGKTRGSLAPNEFWYFWRRFLPFGDLDYIPTEELINKVDIDTFRSEFSGIVEVFQKPFALKALILNYNIDFLDKVFEKAIFIYTKRDIVTNVVSALEARKRQLGSEDQWYSFKIPEYTWLKEISDPIEQTTGQIFCISRAIEQGLEKVPKHKKIIVEYEQFCKQPEIYYQQLVDKLSTQGFDINTDYIGPKKFSVSRAAEKEMAQTIEGHYKRFAETLG